MLSSTHASDLRHPGHPRAAANRRRQGSCPETLELLAIAAYPTRRLNESEVRRLLRFGTRMQVHALLAAHDVSLNYTQEHLELDIAASDKFLAQQISRQRATQDAAGR